MSETWPMKFGFESDPYKLSHPWLIPEKRIMWNRDGLEDLKHEVEMFIKEVTEGYETSLRIWGPWRSGKTWLARYIGKELSKLERFFVLKTEVFQYDPSLETFYKKFVDSLLRSDWITEISKSIKDAQLLENWKNLFGNEDLANALYNIYTKDKLTLSQEWLRGEKLKSADMKDVGVKVNIDSFYEKIEIFKTMVTKSHESFSSFVLIVDQLEAAKGRIAQGFSDLFRELLDSFYEKFGLILIFTMDSIDDWYDMNFTPALEYRIKHTGEMGVLKKRYITSFLRKHHEAYRSQTWEGSDQLSPFNEESILHLASIMEAQYMYPNFLLKNCGILVRKLVDLNESVVTKEIVNTERDHLKYMIKGS